MATARLISLTLVLWRFIGLGKIMKVYSKIIFILTLCLVTFAVTPVFAAELFFDAQTKKLGVGQEFLINLFLNTSGESINAIDGKVYFPKELLELTEIRSGGSIINFWIEKPKLEQSGIIVFSGVIPSGYQETKGPIFSIVFIAKAKSNGVIKIRDANVLLNNGQGTEASLTVSDFSFAIQGTAQSGTQIAEKEDHDPPEEFKPEIANNPDIFDGKWFLVFVAQDKGSGIDHYEVREGKKPFIVAESPYFLQNQNLDKDIAVKAVDSSGNERVVAVPPQNPLPWYKNYSILVILIIVLIIIGVISKNFYDKNT